MLFFSLKRESFDQNLLVKVTKGNHINIAFYIYKNPKNALNLRLFWNRLQEGFEDAKRKQRLDQTIYGVEKLEFLNARCGERSQKVQ